MRTAGRPRGPQALPSWVRGPYYFRESLTQIFKILIAVRKVAVLTLASGENRSPWTGGNESHTAP